MEIQPVRVLYVAGGSDETTRIVNTLAASDACTFAVSRRDTLAAALEELSQGCLCGVMLIDTAVRDVAGAETVRQILERAPGLPLVFLVDGDGHSLGLELIREGAQEYLVKGEDTSARLVRTLLSCMARRVQGEEAKLRRLERDQQVLRLDSLGTMAGGIAHDFNNLLMGILGNADLLLQELEAGTPEHARVQDMSKAGRRAADLSNQMLAYSGHGRFVVEPINIVKLLGQMGSLLEMSIPKNVTIEYRFDEDLPPVLADNSQVYQLVTNLFTNAVDALGDRGGCITMSAALKDADRTYLASSYVDDALPEGCYVRVVIEDDGHGMDETTRHRAFDPFFTTRFPGRGLGLSAALGIVRGHNGAIRICSEEGKGTMVEALLPALKGEAPSEDQAEAPASGRETAAEAVLLVDDEESVRITGRHILEKMGFNVVVAPDGAEALERFDRLSGKIRAVLLDMSMPGTSGLETLRRLRARSQDVPIILSSGFDEDDILERLAGHNPSAFVQKPYRKESLEKAMRKVLGLQ